MKLGQERLAIKIVSYIFRNEGGNKVTVSQSKATYHHFGEKDIEGAPYARLCILFNIPKLSTVTYIS